MGVWKKDRGKPVIGLAGGIGSGKSTIAGFFAELGCGVIDSDVLAREALEMAEVKAGLGAVFGGSIFDEDGRVNRSVLAERAFSDEAQLKKLNAVVHPVVQQMRDQRMAEFLGDARVQAIVWDAPLLFEAGYAPDCDCIVFVNVPRGKRLERVLARRGWNVKELEKREKFQIPLDKKESVADYCIDNSGDPASSRAQVERILSQILAAPS